MHESDEEETIIDLTDEPKSKGKGKAKSEQLASDRYRYNYIDHAQTM